MRAVGRKYDSAIAHFRINSEECVERQNFFDLSKCAYFTEFFETAKIRIIPNSACRNHFDGIWTKKHIFMKIIPQSLFEKKNKEHDLPYFSSKRTKNMFFRFFQQKEHQKEQMNIKKNKKEHVNIQGDNFKTT